MRQIGARGHGIGTVVEGQDVGRRILVGILCAHFQRQPAVAVLLGEFIAAAQLLADEAIEQRRELRQQRGAVDIGRCLGGKLDRAHAHRKIPLAQYMVQHDESHVLRMLGHVPGNGLLERELEAYDASRIVIAHPDIGAGQLEAIHAHAEIAAQRAAAKRLHAVMLETRRLAHQCLGILELRRVAMGRDHQTGAGLPELAFQLQTQARRILVQQLIGAFHKLLAIELLQLAQLVGKIAPESINLLRLQRLDGLALVVVNVCAHE